jgi:hypothetical protein
MLSFMGFELVGGICVILGSDAEERINGSIALLIVAVVIVSIMGIGFLRMYFSK